MSKKTNTKEDSLIWDGVFTSKALDAHYDEVKKRIKAMALLPKSGGKPLPLEIDKPPPKPQKFVINISIEVKEYLDKKAIGMGDSPDAVLRRVLGLPPKKSAKDLE